MAAMNPGESVESYVDRLIADNKVAVFSKSYCPYCIRAKEALNRAGFLKSGAVVLELDTMNNGSAIQGYLQKRTGQSTVPNIFVRSQHIGGCDKTLAALSQGTLEQIYNA